LVAVELAERLTIQTLGEHQVQTQFFQLLLQQVVVVLKVMQVDLL
jgi:hypothetical protein